MSAAADVLVPPLAIERGVVLLYRLALDNRLAPTVSPDRLKAPARGQSAFQTDLCVLEEVSPGTKIPRVVLEFKTGLSTHDVLVYSTKARRHKEIYSYLRYGVVVANEVRVSGKFFTHNEALDFCVAAGSYKDNIPLLREVLAGLLDSEVQASRRLENVAFGETHARLFRSEVILDEGVGRVT